MQPVNDGASIDRLFDVRTADASLAATPTVQCQSPARHEQGKQLRLPGHSRCAGKHTSSNDPSGIRPRIEPDGTVRPRRHGPGWTPATPNVSMMHAETRCSLACTLLGQLLGHDQRADGPRHLCSGVSVELYHCYYQDQHQPILNDQQ